MINPFFRRCLYAGVLLLLCVSVPNVSVVAQSEGYSWDGFLKPNPGSEQTKLVMLDGFEPGKVPVVFIHGLLSSPESWKPVVDALKANPELKSRYQFWTFGYPTGLSYVMTAADLRDALNEQVSARDPQRQDPWLHQAVLVGHSMGGLLAKLQVTRSGNLMWGAVAGHPQAVASVTPEERQRIERTFFFEPVRGIRRVVYIATPHQGSLYTQTLVGQIGRRLVKFPEAVQANYEAHLRRNENLPNRFPKRLPTSVDHLAPGNPILEAMARMPTAPQIKFHSIIGDGYATCPLSFGDQYVTVASARQAHVVSELRIPETHTEIHKSPQTILELQRILRLHWIEAYYELHPTLKSPVLDQAATTVR